MSGQYTCPYCESPRLSIKGRICNNCQTIFPSGTQFRRANVGRISNNHRHYTTQRPSDRPTTFTNLEPA